MREGRLGFEGGMRVDYIECAESGYGSKTRESAKSKSNRKESTVLLLLHYRNGYVQYYILYKCVKL